jgi:hypothetical protein
MTQAKTCHRIVVIAGSVPENEKHEYREPMPTQRTTGGKRIVIFRNGEVVSSKRKRRAAVLHSS